jgi:hypothetical protein
MMHLFRLVTALAFVHTTTAGLPPIPPIVPIEDDEYPKPENCSAVKESYQANECCGADGGTLIGNSLELVLEEPAGYAGAKLSLENAAFANTFRNFRLALNTFANAIGVEPPYLLYDTRVQTAGTFLTHAAFGKSGQSDPIKTDEWLRWIFNGVDILNTASQQKKIPFEGCEVLLAGGLLGLGAAGAPLTTVYAGYGLKGDGTFDFADPSQLVDLQDALNAMFKAGCDTMSGSTQIYADRVVRTVLYFGQIQEFAPNESDPFWELLDDPLRLAKMAFGFLRGKRPASQDAAALDIGAQYQLPIAIIGTQVVTGLLNAVWKTVRSAMANADVGNLTPFANLEKVVQKLLKGVLSPALRMLVTSALGLPERTKIPPEQLGLSVSFDGQGLVVDVTVALTEPLAFTCSPTIKIDNVLGAAIPSLLSFPIGPNDPYNATATGPEVLAAILTSPSAIPTGLQECILSICAIDPKAPFCAKF